MNEKEKTIATNLAYEIIKDVGRAIRPYVGNPESGNKLKLVQTGHQPHLLI